VVPDRDNNESPEYLVPLFIAGGNPTAPKGAPVTDGSLMKFGSLPPATDPRNPSDVEFATTMARVHSKVFDTLEPRLHADSVTIRFVSDDAYAASRTL
jgi:hypothetical protein